MSEASEVFGRVEAALAGDNPAGRAANLLAAALSAQQVSPQTALARLREARDRVTTYDGREALESLLAIIEAAAGEKPRLNPVYARLACMEHKTPEGEFFTGDTMYAKYCRKWPLEPPGQAAFDIELRQVRDKQQENPV